MKNVKTLLEILTARMPPGKGQRHNITLAPGGDLELCLFLGDIYLPFGLEEVDDLEQEPDVLAEQIIELAIAYPDIASRSEA